MEFFLFLFFVWLAYKNLRNPPADLLSNRTNIHLREIIPWIGLISSFSCLHLLVMAIDTFAHLLGFVWLVFGVGKSGFCAASVSGDKLHYKRPHLVL